MRYLIIFLIMFSVITFDVNAETYDFRKAKWEMSLSQVIKSEKNKYLERKKEAGKETLIYYSSYCNYPAKIYYSFSDKKLSLFAAYLSGNYKLQDKKPFLNVLSCLNSQYKNPTRENHTSIVSIVEYFWKRKKDTVSLYMVNNGKDKYNVIVTFIPEKK